MPEKKWTKEQLDAISFRGGNLLVAAGAGSGKTSVLVERVLGLIGARAEAFGEGGSGDECGGESGGGSEHEGERGGESGGESESGGGGERESGGERGGESRGGSEHESGSERESENALARSGGAGPVGIDRLLIVTFTNAAAAEMKERLADALTGELEAAEAVLRRMGGGGDGGSGEDGDGGNGGGYGSFGGGRERGQARRQDGDRAGARRARARASHLRRQLILLGSASISTIHSFCLNVIKENIHLADGVDPNFRLLDDAEASLMKYDALIPVLEEKYAEPFNERFEMLAESFGDSRDDRGMAEAILAAHSFAQGFPWPGRWLAGMVEAAHIETEDDFDGSAWNAEIAARLAEGLSALLGALARNRGALLACIAKEEGVRAAENAIGALERMGAGLGLGDELGLGAGLGLGDELGLGAGLGAGLGLGDGLGLGAELGIGGQAPARPPKWRAVKEQLEILGDMQALCPRARRNEDGACKKAREAVKAATRAFLSDAAPFYRLEMRDILDEFKWMRAVLSELVDAVLKLDKRYGDEKRRRAALDFNDLEHLALKILIESGDDGGDGDDGGGENSEESWSGEYGRGSGDDGDGEGAMKGEAPASATAASAPGAHAAAMPWAPATRAARAAQSAQSSQGVAEPVAGASDASRISGISGISGAPAATFSAVAEAYRDRFAEVLVDEYQDSNLVQELIIQAVSKASNGGGAGGTFMVGDVKQSIYRFRQSMPELFMSKYTEYAPLGHPGDAGAAGEGRGGGGAGRGTLITLFKNFRSDPRLLDFINAVFSKIMSKKAGELDYTESEWLLPGAPRGSGGAGNAASDGAAGAAVEIHLLSKKPVAPGLGFALGAGDAGGAGNAGGPGESNGTDGSNEAGDPDGAGRSGGADGAGESSESGESGESGEFEDADAAESAQNAVHEARFVASRIAELMQTATVAGRDGSRRPLAYRDIAVLMRAVGGTAQPFADELANLGVPAYTEAGAGYFESYEIDIMLSVLKIIDNPLQDIPMFAVMLSPIFSFPPERAAKIKWDASNAAGRGGNSGNSGNNGNDGGNGGNDSSGSINSNGGDGGDGGDGPSSGGADSFSGGSASPPLFHCLKAAASAGDQKAEGALRQLGEWRRMAAEMPVSELIWHIMQSTGFYARARAMPGGAVRQANLRQLFEYARQYEQISYKGIFNFIRFVDKLAEQGGDVAGAKIIGESDDIVRIMSIHKSKGLEFPVVFLCGCGRKFNMLDASKHVLLHRRLGFGPNYVDLGRRVSDYSIPKRIIARAIRNEALSEEMRILYVAMTRAKERLLLVGTVRNAERFVGGLAETLGQYQAPGNAGAAAGGIAGSGGAAGGAADGGARGAAGRAAIATGGAGAAAGGIAGSGDAAAVGGAADGGARGAAGRAAAAIGGTGAAGSMAGRSAAGGATAGGATGNAGAAAGGGPAEKKLRPEHALKAANYMSWIASALMLRSLEGAAPQCGSAGDFGSASDRAGGSAGDRAGGILGNGAPGGGGGESGLALVAIHGVAEYAAGNAESTDGAECAADGAEAPAVAGAQPSHAEQPGQPKQGRERGQELKPEREFERERGQELERAQEPKQGRAPEQDLELEREIGRRLAWEYPYQRLAGMPLKVSVTEMSEGAPGARHMLESSDASPYAGMAGFYARAEAAERAAFDAPAATGATATGDRARGQAQEPHSLAVPSFLAAKRQFSKAQIGTFTHLVLERIDFRSVSGIADIDRAIAGMVAGKALLPEQAQAVDRRALMLFFESEAGRLARAASELRRETTFTIKLSAAEYFSLLGRPAGRPDGGSVLLQGSIDCWFQDEGGLTLIDYKTGYFAEADIVSAERSKYRRQIALYALALKRITGLDANRRFICLLDSGKCVRV